MGPLPRTRTGKRFILVVVDYATRYPEVSSTLSVAEKLVEVFSRHGVPKEILTDQNTNFMSELLRVKPIRTSPYHSQTDGLVERYNQTIKSMLKKVIIQEPKSWDKLLPLALFAFHEVPQKATGFSPFELVLGKDILDP